jgi:hypothetical protein
MGYRCPVCDHPQSDADHLANHLAFTALARGGDHEEWLDAHVPDWGDLDPASLGERVTEPAEDAEFPQVFDDTTTDAGGGKAGHGHGSRDGNGDDPLFDEAGSRAAGAVSDDAEEVLEEARELTRRRRENAADEAGDDSETE